MSQYVELLREAIRRLHGVEAEYVESVPVKETFEGETVWEGVVEVFDLKGHPKATRVYAWAHKTEPGNVMHEVTVLQIPPLDSPLAAVRAAIAHEYRGAVDA